MRKILLILSLSFFSVVAFGQSVILMPEINYITHLKSMDFDLRLDSMMRAHNYRAFDRDGARPKEVTYVSDNGDRFFAGYNEEDKILTIFIMTNNYDQFSKIRSQVESHFKRKDKGKFVDFFTEIYSLGVGLGTIEIGYSKENKYVIKRDLPIPNYYWNVDKYQ
jgi:hypothetical protein